MTTQLINWDKNLIALRSLRSEHHATHINPKILNINWFLGKRCNYDCSYCSPGIHDWVSPHIKLDYVKNFVDQLDYWASEQNKTFHTNLTGGEPFIHPNIIDILKIIRQAPSCGEHLTAVTNGSMPTDLYLKSFEYLSHITISLHLERTELEIQRILDTILQLKNSRPDRWVNVQVMCLPGKFSYLEKVVLPFLDQHQIKYTLRRIRPWVNEVVDDWMNQPKKEILKTAYDKNWLTAQHEKEKVFLDQNLETIYQEHTYYSEDELTWLESHIPTTVWQNIGLWNENSEYVETNSDVMVSNNRNRFNGWKCWIGLDSIHIDAYGTVYKSVCRADGSIGNIDGKITWPTGPTTCPKQWCTSNVDLTVRKSKLESTNLIS